MRRIIALTLFLLIGCAETPATTPAYAPGSAIESTAGGGGGNVTCAVLGAYGTCLPAGGGGGSDATADLNCPIDFVQQLKVEIAAVPEKMYRTALESQWSVIDARANSSGPSELAFAVGGFTSMVDYMERRHELSEAQADRMRSLVGCYR